MKSVVLAFGFSLFSLQPAWAARSDLRALLPYISDVKDQKGRNTCTVQTTAAILESYLLKKTGQDMNLSEEWLQYLASVTNESGGSKGSVVMTNVRNALRWGVPTEATLPYTKGEWKGSETEAEEICGPLKGRSSSMDMTRCLFGKFPAFYLTASDQTLGAYAGGAKFSAARSEAQDIRAYFTGLNPRVIAKTQVKALLDSKKTLALEVNLFHGAWNTGLATIEKMGRDKDLYSRGVVTYPELGSIDRQVSPGHKNRHAVQIVGYDDDIEVTYKMNMTDGTTRTFKRRGVYIFKNSWGTKDFGKKFTYGKMKIPGFGMILMDHANEFGKFTAFEQ